MAHPCAKNAQRAQRVEYGSLCLHLYLHTSGTNDIFPARLPCVPPLICRQRRWVISSTRPGILHVYTFIPSLLSTTSPSFSLHLSLNHGSSLRSCVCFIGLDNAGNFIRYFREVLCQYYIPTLGHTGPDYNFEKLGFGLYVALLFAYLCYCPGLHMTFQLPVYPTPGHPVRPCRLLLQKCFLFYTWYCRSPSTFRQYLLRLRRDWLRQQLSLPTFRTLPSSESGIVGTLLAPPTARTIFRLLALETSTSGLFLGKMRYLSCQRGLRVLSGRLMLLKG